MTTTTDTIWTCPKCQTPYSGIGLVTCAIWAGRCAPCSRKAYIHNAFPRLSDVRRVKTSAGRIPPSLMERWDDVIDDLRATSSAYRLFLLRHTDMPLYGARIYDAQQVQTVRRHMRVAVVHWERNREGWRAVFEVARRMHVLDAKRRETEPEAGGACCD